MEENEIKETTLIFLDGDDSVCVLSWHTIKFAHLALKLLKYKNVFHCFWSRRNHSGHSILKNNTLIYIFPVGGQTAGPNGLTCFEVTHGYPGGKLDHNVF